MVPVIRDVDSKGFYDLAEELMEISSRARDASLMPADLQGGTFSISSLGGIGGILTGHAIYDEKGFMRVDGRMQLADFIHHVCIYVQTTGGIYQQHQPVAFC